MKLRTNKNSLRIRLSQAELEEFRSSGFVHEKITFSKHGNQYLEYSLIQADHESISVSYMNNHIRIYIPLQQAKQWCESNETGFQCHIPLDDKESLFVLVEKDFQCLQPRPYEDESDNFPNPNAKPC